MTVTDGSPARNGWSMTVSSVRACEDKRQTQSKMKLLKSVGAYVRGDEEANVLGQGVGGDELHERG